jgi:hypothetical protein
MTGERRQQSQERKRSQQDFESKKRSAERDVIDRRKPTPAPQAIMMRLNSGGRPARSDNRVAHAEPSSRGATSHPSGEPRPWSQFAAGHESGSPQTACADRSLEPPEQSKQEAFRIARAGTSQCPPRHHRHRVPRSGASQKQLLHPAGNSRRPRFCASCSQTRGAARCAAISRVPYRPSRR